MHKSAALNIASILAGLWPVKFNASRASSVCIIAIYTLSIAISIYRLYDDVAQSIFVKPPNVTWDDTKPLGSSASAPPTVSSLVMSVFKADEFIGLCTGFGIKMMTLLYSKRIGTFFTKLSKLSRASHSSVWTCNEVCLLVTTVMFHCLAFFFEFIHFPHFYKGKSQWWLLYAAVEVNFTKRLQVDVAALIITTVVATIQRNLVSLQSRLKDSSTANKNSNEVVHEYFEWLKLWRLMERTWGLLVLLVSADALLSGIGACFNSMIAIHKVGLMHMTAAAQLIKAMLEMTKLGILGNTAEGLQQTASTSAINARFSFNNCRFLSKARDLELRIIAASMSECKRFERRSKNLSWTSFMLYSHRSSAFQLSALKLFKISRSQLTQIAGAVVTYLVVLLQFESLVS